MCVSLRLKARFADGCGSATLDVTGEPHGRAGGGLPLAACEQGYGGRRALPLEGRLLSPSPARIGSWNSSACSSSTEPFRALTRRQPSGLNVLASVVVLVPKWFESARATVSLIYFLYQEGSNTMS